MRIYFKGDLTAEYKDRPVMHNSEKDSNLISSLVDTGTNRDRYFSQDQESRGVVLHMPIFDFDFPCELVESSTPGHFHLKMDFYINWLDYQNVLTAMVAAGLLEPGWVAAAIANRAAFLRLPGVKKETSDRTYSNPKDEVEWPPF